MPSTSSPLPFSSVLKTLRASLLSSDSDGHPLFRWFCPFLHSIWTSQSSLGHALVSSFMSRAPRHDIKSVVRIYESRGWKFDFKYSQLEWYILSKSYDGQNSLFKQKNEVLDEMVQKWWRRLSNFRTRNVSKRKDRTHSRSRRFRSWKESESGRDFIC